MPIDTVSTDRLAQCPSCGKSMRFARSCTDIGVKAPSQLFECKECRLEITAEQVLGLLPRWTETDSGVTVHIGVVE